MSASFHCYFPEGNVRFERVGVPRPKTQTVIVGYIMVSSSPISNTCAVKRLPIEVGEIQYLPSTVTTVPTPQKGMIPLFLFIIFFLTSSLAGASSRFRKHQRNSTPPPIASSSTTIIEPTAANVTQPIPQPSLGSETMSDRDVSDHPADSLPPAKKKKRA
jgi:hypothetical protein